MLTEHRISSLVLVLRKDGDGSIRLNILRSLEYIFLHNGDEYCWEAQDSSKLSKLTTNNNLYGLPALLLQLTERYFFSNSLSTDNADTVSANAKIFETGTRLLQFLHQHLLRVTAITDA